jgi:hypothetical protein
MGMGMDKRLWVSISSCDSKADFLPLSLPFSHVSQMLCYGRLNKEGGGVREALETLL